MSGTKNPYSVRVDIKYIEFLYKLLKEARDIANGKFKNNRGERLYKMRLQDKAIQQLRIIIREHKKEFGI